MKVKVENICESLITIRRNDGSDKVVLAKGKSHTFDSEKEADLFNTATMSLSHGGFIKLSKVSGTTKPVKEEKPLDEDIVNAIADINKEINDLKKAFKATKDKEEKKNIKLEIKKLTESIEKLKS